MNTAAAKTPAARGKGPFIAGSITLLLFSAVHMIPMFIAIFIEPTKPAEVEAKRAMTAVAVDMGPFHTTWAGLSQLLSASYSALLFFVVALNLVALPAVIAHGRLRAMATVNVVFVGVLLAIAVIYQFPPPGVFALIAEAFFIAALARATPSPRLG
jgi:hypothetical protein